MPKATHGTVQSHQAAFADMLYNGKSKTLDHVAVERREAATTLAACMQSPPDRQ